MTIEKLEKAKRLKQEIENFKNQLERIDRVTKETNLIISGNNSNFNLPLDIRDTIILLCKTTYQTKLEKVIKEFEEL